MSKTINKEYVSPSTHIMNIDLHEELLSHTLIVDPGEEGDQEDAEIHAREWDEENDVWGKDGLW